jgi:predicted RNA-binding protein with PUA-like domain
MAYWLFKSEPDEFGIDDLAALNGKPEPWDGIRNYQARNILRDQVAVGDEVLIYHSSCKHIGVAGTARVTRDAYPDPDQFNPDSKYFDSKATDDNVRWYCVDVVFAEKFDRLIPLAELKIQHELKDMMLLKQGRLSVQPVTTEEWHLIQNIR